MIDHILITKKINLGVNEFHSTRNGFHWGVFKPSYCHKKYIKVKKESPPFDFIFLDQFIGVLSWEINLLTW